MLYYLCPAETYHLLGVDECRHINTYEFEDCENTLKEIMGFYKREHSRESSLDQGIRRAWLRDDHKRGEENPGLRGIRLCNKLEAVSPWKY